MAKNQNTMAKRQREMEKKRKAEEKRRLKRAKKERAQEQPVPEVDETDDGQTAPDDLMR